MMAKIIVGEKRRKQRAKRVFRKKEEKRFEFSCKLSRHWPYEEEQEWESSKLKAERMILEWCVHQLHVMVWVVPRCVNEAVANGISGRKTSSETALGTLLQPEVDRFEAFFRFKASSKSVCSLP